MDSSYNQLHFPDEVRQHFTSWQLSQLFILRAEVKVFLNDRSPFVESINNSFWESLLSLSCWMSWAFFARAGTRMFCPCVIHQKTLNLVFLSTNGKLIVVSSWLRFCGGNWGASQELSGSIWPLRVTVPRNCRPSCSTIFPNNSYVKEVDQKTLHPRCYWLISTDWIIVRQIDRYLSWKNSAVDFL